MCDNLVLCATLLGDNDSREVAWKRKEDVARRIQHTNVRPDATQADIERLLAECVEHDFHAAVVSPIWLARAVKTLAGTGVRVCTALDLPLGGETTATVVRAAAEAQAALADLTRLVERDDRAGLRAALARIKARRERLS